MFIGAIIKLFKGGYDYFTLPGKIKELERENSIPVINKFGGLERYKVRNKIIEGTLYNDLDNARFNHSKIKLVKQKYIKSLKENFNMSQYLLKSTPANKSDVESLAIGLKELAVCLEENCKDFETKLGGKVEEVKREVNRQEVKHMQDIQQVNNNIHIVYQESQNVKRGLFIFSIISSVFNLIVIIYMLRH